MTRIAFIADVHTANHRRFGGERKAGINQRCRLVLEALDAAVAKAQEKDCDPLVILGDLFDTAHPEPQIITAVQGALWDKIDTWILRGNHDIVSDAWGDDALGPLEYTPEFNETGVHTVSTPFAQGFHHEGVFFVPFRSGPAREWFPDAVDEVVSLSDSPQVLAFHLGIIDDATPAWLRDAHDAVPLEMVREACARKDIHAAIAGNWHQHRVWEGKGGEATVVQCGALVPTGFDNPGAAGYGSLIIWESETNTFTRHEIPGPRFLSVRNSKDMDEVERTVKAGNRVFVRVLGDLLAAVDSEARLAGLKLEALVEEPDGSEAKAEARTAATVARSAETLDAALAGFVREMPAIGGIDREDVLARARRYLNA